MSFWAQISCTQDDALWSTRFRVLTGTCLCVGVLDLDLTLELSSSLAVKAVQSRSNGVGIGSTNNVHCVKDLIETFSVTAAEMCNFTGRLEYPS